MPAVGGVRLVGVPTDGTPELLRRVRRWFQSRHALVQHWFRGATQPCTASPVRVFSWIRFP